MDMVSLVDALVRMLAEALTIGNAILGAWLNVPDNAAGPLDPSVTLSGSGSDLAGYIASSAFTASNIISVMVDALF